MVALLALLGHDTSTAGEVDEGDIEVEEGDTEKDDTADHMTLRSLRSYDSAVLERQRRPSIFKQDYGVSVKDLIDCDSMKSINDGTQIESTVTKWPAVAHITAEGQIEYNGQIYSSLSTAGKVVKGGMECNGWDFWAVRILGEPVSLKTLRARYIDIRDGED